MNYFPSRIRDVVTTVKKDLEKLFRKQEFQKLHDDILWMESVLMESLGESYFGSLIRDVIVTMKERIQRRRTWNRTCASRSFRNSTTTSDYLGGRYSHDSGIRHLVSVMRGSLEKDTGPLLLRDFQKLADNASLMDSLLRDSSGESYDREMMIKFQNRIRNVVDEAVNQVHFKDRPGILVKFNGLNLTSTRLPKKLRCDQSFRLAKLPRIIQEIACINDELKKSHKDREEVIGITAPQNVENTSSAAGNSALLDPPQKLQSKDDKLIGHEKDLEEMLDGLTGQSSNLKIFPIIGMAGIGKTTFAKELYDHPLVMYHFYVRAWVTVSQEYGLRGLLLGLLSCITNLSDEIHDSGREQLQEKLYRSLRGKRYLIVVDDVWDHQVWDDLKRGFPNDMNGSRVLLTSRLHAVAIHATPDVSPHLLQCLSLDESWELLCSKSFANGSCPLELLPSSREIAHKCHGLPLAIVVVGGLLSKMNKTSAVWEEVAQNVVSMIMDGHQCCQEIPARSYNHLPDPLKPCFLYMGVFPEDYEISSTKLIRLWIAEGFVQLKKQKSLEEVAKDYLEDLIARCMLLAKRKTSDGKI